MHVTTLCLGALAFAEATGYEIKKMFEEGPFSHFLEASYGSIYPALTKLMDAGLVQCRVEMQDSRPDKKIYALTPEGHEELRRRLQEAPAEDKFRSEFLFVITFAHLLPRDYVIGLVDAKLSEFEAELAKIDEGSEAETPGMRFVQEYGRHIYRHSIDFITLHRHWLEETGASSRAAETGAGRASVAAPFVRPGAGFLPGE